MPLRLITGPANVGKTGKVLEEAFAACATGASSALVVPRLDDVHRLESELSEKSSLGIRVSMLDQFIRDLWSLFGDHRRIIGRYEREAIIGRLIRDESERFGPTSQTPGFRSLATRLAAHAHVVGQRAPSEDEHPIAEILTRYRRELNVCDLLEITWAADLLSELSPPVGFIGIVRFDALTPEAARLILGLARSNPVACALTWEEGFAPTRANDATVAQFAIKAQEHTIVRKPDPQSEIATLAHVLYAGPSGVHPTGQVAIGTASGVEAECELLADAAASALADGVLPERVAVVLPDVSRKWNLLRTALRAKSVPFEFHSTVRVDQTPFGRAYRGLVRLAAGDGGRSEALEFLASPFSGVDPGLVDALDRRWRAKRTTAARELLDSLAVCGKSTRITARQARAACRAALSDRTLQEWKKLADILLLTGLENGRVKPQDIDVVAYRAVSDTIAEMAAVAGGSFGVEDVLATISKASIREGFGESSGAVQVIELDGVGARRFDVVIVGGMSEKELPLGPIESVEDELLRSEEIAAKVHRGDTRRLQFYSLITRARKRLILVRQDADSEGRGLLPSALWEDVMDAYRTPEDVEASRLSSSLLGTTITRAEIERFAPIFTSGRQDLRVKAPDMAFQVVERSKITSESGCRALSQERALSVTEVEAYLECPYKWFYEQIVRPEEIDAELDARELGTYAHRLLAEFYRNLIAEGPWSRVFPDHIGEALAKFDELASEAAARIPARSSFDELALARSVAGARNVIGADANFLPEFVPTHVELSFGEDPPFSFAGSVFRGRIDRIDASPDSVFITDYKSSRDIPGVARFESLAKVQPVLYAIAARDVLGRPVSGSVYRSMRSGRLRGFWRRDLLGEVPRGMCEEDGIGEHEFAELVERTSERVACAIEGMRTGRIPSNPSVRGACTYCAASLVCEGARG